MARPRRIDDGWLLEAAALVIARVGPGFTLAQVAAEAGVSVGSVSQRFGSKLRLSQALSRNWTEETVRRMREQAAAADDPVVAVRRMLVRSYSALAEGEPGGAESAANHLGQLAVDLADPELRALVGEHYAAIEAEVRTLLRTAAGLDDWHGPGPAVAARVLLSVVNGVSMDWSIRPKGRLADRLAADVDAVLGGWYRKGSSTARPPR